MAAAALIADLALFLAGRGDPFWSLAGYKSLWGWLFLLLNTGLLAAAVLVRADVLRGLSAVRLRWVCLAACVVTLFVGAWALQSFPNSGDEYAYLFQAETYAAGRIWNAPPPLGQAMASIYTWVTPTKWAGSYPPGWPVVLAPLVPTGIPVWAVNLALLPVAILLLYDLVARRAGREAAMAAAVLFGLSPFTIFNAASYFPHLFSATSVLVAVWAADRLLERDRAGYGLLLGVAVGVLGVTRMVDAVIVLFAVCPFMLARPIFWRRWAWWVAAGGAPFLAGLLWYQWVLSGNALQPTYYFGGRTVDHLYFDGPSIKRGVLLIAKHGFELALWASPPAVILWLCTLALKVWARKVEPLDAILPIAILLFVFYPFDPGNRYGPRYYFDVWPAVSFTMATALPLIPQRFRVAAGATFALAIAYSAALLAPLALGYHEVVEERRDVFLGGERLAGGPAVVCIRSATGAQLPMQALDLSRNDIEAKARVLYVRCDLTTPAAILAAFPDRTLWFYDREDRELHGHFSRDASDRGGGGGRGEPAPH